jgi:hypothetical protein
VQPPSPLTGDDSPILSPNASDDNQGPPVTNDFIPGQNDDGSDNEVTEENSFVED